MAIVVKDWTDVQMMFHAIDCLICALQSLCMEVSEEKSQAVISLRGRRLRKFQSHHIERSQHGPVLTFAGTHKTYSFPIASDITCLGIRVSYQRMTSASIDHRLQLAKAAFSRMKLWLHRRRGLALSKRIALWRQTVFSILSYGIPLLQWRTSHVWSLHTAMLVMFRRIIGNHSYISHMTHQEVLLQHCDPEPLHFSRLHLESIRSIFQARQSRSECSDITHGTAWTFVDQNLCLVEHCIGQFCRTTIGPDPERISAHETYICPHCHATCHGLANFRRRLTTRHAHAPTRQVQRSIMEHSQAGLPQCKHCKNSFSTWRAFKMHIQCHSCCLHLPSEIHHMQVPVIDVDAIRDQPFGAALLHALSEEDWRSISGLKDACQYMQKQCLLCHKHFERTQSLIFHLKTDHTCFHSRAMTRAAMIIQQLCASPCRFCEQNFTSSHMCPVLIQCATILAQGLNDDLADDDGEWPSNKHCYLCGDTLPTFAELTKHLATAHRLRRFDYNQARDTLRGAPTNMCTLLADVHQYRLRS